MPQKPVYAPIVRVLGSRLHHDEAFSWLQDPAAPLTTGEPGDRVPPTKATPPCRVRCASCPWTEPADRTQESLQETADRLLVATGPGLRRRDVLSRRPVLAGSMWSATGERGMTPMSMGPVTSSADEVAPSLADETITPSGVPHKAIEGRSLWRIAWIRLKRDRVAIGGAIVIGLLVIVAITAPLLSHWFGTPPNEFNSDLIDPNLGVPTGHFGGVSGTHI